MSTSPPPFGVSKGSLRNSMMLPSPVRFTRRPLMDSDGRVDQIASGASAAEPVCDPRPCRRAGCIRPHPRQGSRQVFSLAIYDCSATIGSATANSCPPKFRERISRLKMEVWERCHGCFERPGERLLPRKGKISATLFIAVHESVHDAVDGSSTGTRVPKMWALFEAPTIRRS